MALSVPVAVFQFGSCTAMVSVGPVYQSPFDSVYVWVLPSVYVTVPVPLVAPAVLATTKVSASPEPPTAIVCPSATALSGVPGATFGQRSGVLSRVSSAPGVQPSAARSSAEKLCPVPSMSAAAGSASSLIPMLSNAALSPLGPATGAKAVANTCIAPFVAVAVAASGRVTVATVLPVASVTESVNSETGCACAPPGVLR